MTAPPAISTKRPTMDIVMTKMMNAILLKIKIFETMNFVVVRLYPIACVTGSCQLGLPIYLTTLKGL